MNSVVVVVVAAKEKNFGHDELCESPMMMIIYPLVIHIPMQIFQSRDFPSG
jgi:hypothetical protein